MECTLTFVDNKLCPQCNPNELAVGAMWEAMEMFMYIEKRETGDKMSHWRDTRTIPFGKSWELLGGYQIVGVRE